MFFGSSPSSKPWFLFGHGLQVFFPFCLGWDYSMYTRLPGLLLADEIDFPALR